MKRFKNFRRPSLRWLSEAQIVDFSNNVLYLFLDPGEEMRLPPPPGINCLCFWVNLGHASYPYIKWEQHGALCIAWLKHFSDRRLPCFDIQIGDGPVHRVPFNSPKAIIPAQLVKSLAHYFPFMPTDNYLAKGGSFIA